MSHCYNKSKVAASPICGENTMAGLIIFILVILQFQKRNHCKDGGNNQLFDNSVLFILVLFIIACCGKVKLGC